MDASLLAQQNNINHHGHQNNLISNTHQNLPVNASLLAQQSNSDPTNLHAYQNLSMNNTEQY
jgi:hypothetical protein